MSEPSLPESAPSRRRGVLADYRRLTPSERRLWRAPLMWVGALAILFVPLLYVGIYLSSVWDPYGTLNRLPAALVNADQGAVSRGRASNLGRDLVAELREDPPVRFVEYASEEAAQAAVQRGEAYFALTIPRDFSRRAVAGSSAQHAELRLYTAPGTSYFASRVGRSVATELTASLNGRLGTTRWEVVQASFGEVQRGFRDLKTAAGKLRDGATTLETGAGRLATGAADLARGTGQARSAGQKLTQGAQSLSAGVGTLTAGTARLSGALRQLGDAAPGQAQLRSLQSGAKEVAGSAAQLAGGLGAVQNGARQTGAGALTPQITAATQGARQLATGAQALQGGVERLAQGNLKLKTSLAAVTSALPSDSSLQTLGGGAQTLAQGTGKLAASLGAVEAGARRLATGTRELQTGTGQLRGGLDALYRQIPSRTEQLGGDPEGLASSAVVTETRTADVQNNGSAFSPYFTALALWVGCTLSTFVFPYLLLPESGRTTGQLARVLRKYSVPAVYVTAQALIVVLGLHLLGVTFLHPGLVVLSAVVVSLTFMMLILALNLLLGAAGRLLAIVLLVVQLAASGGTFPVELSPAFFQKIHAFLPVTDGVNALRSAMFGSYEGQYGAFMVRLLLVALGSFLVALLARRRWQFAPDEKFRSPLLSDVG